MTSGSAINKIKSKRKDLIKENDIKSSIKSGGKSPPIYSFSSLGWETGGRGREWGRIKCSRDGAAAQCLHQSLTAGSMEQVHLSWPQSSRDQAGGHARRTGNIPSSWFHLVRTVEPANGKCPSISLFLFYLMEMDFWVIQGFSENHNIAQLQYMSSEKGSFFWQCTVTWYEEPTSQTNSLLVLKKKKKKKTTMLISIPDWINSC